MEGTKGEGKRSCLGHVTKVPKWQPRCPVMHSNRRCTVRRSRRFEKLATPSIRKEQLVLCGSFLRVIQTAAESLVAGGELGGASGPSVEPLGDSTTPHADAPRSSLHGFRHANARPTSHRQLRQLRTRNDSKVNGCMIARRSSTPPQRRGTIDGPPFVGEEATPYDRRRFFACG